MTAEESFLPALDADPADDVTRLVYADWLEERGDVRGEYLRREVELGQRSEDDPLHRAAEARCAELRGQVPRPWLRRAGKRFDVWLMGYPLEAKILAIKAIRSLMPTSLVDAKRLSELTPSRVQAAVIRPVAELARAQFAELWPAFDYRGPAENGEAAPGVRVVPAGAREPAWPPMPRGVILRTSERWAVQLRAIRAGKELEAEQVIAELFGGEVERARRIVALGTAMPLYYAFGSEEASRWRLRLEAVADVMVEHLSGERPGRGTAPRRCNVNLVSCDRASRAELLAALRLTTIAPTSEGWGEWAALTLPHGLRTRVSLAEADRLRWIFPEGATLEVIE